MKVRELQPHAGIVVFNHNGRNSESRMRENRPSGLMRGGKQTVIGVAYQSVASRLLYTRKRASYNRRNHCAIKGAILSSNSELGA